MKNIDYQKAEMIKNSEMENLDKIKELMKIKDYQFSGNDKKLLELNGELLKFIDIKFSNTAKEDGWNPLQKEMSMKLNYIMFKKRDKQKFEKIRFQGDEN